MKKSLIAVTLGILTIAWSCAAEEFMELTEDMKQIKVLREEINLLNLLNGLNLTDEQSRRIMNLAVEARTIRQKAVEENAQLFKDFKEVLLTLKEGIMDKNWRPEPEVESKAGQLNHALKEIRRRNVDKLQALSEELKDILTPGQFAIIADYKPCLIPPKDLKSPTRAGQAFDTAPVERFLTRARYIPTERYARLRENLVEEFLDRLEKHLGPIPDNKTKKEEVLRVIEEARAMTDEEFTLEKEDMATRLSAKPERKEFFLPGFGVDKVGRFLLDEGIIPILEKRLALSRDFTPNEGTDLDSIPSTPGAYCPTMKN
jgi:hypothetical protein